jgi:hypothetical protein
VLLGVVGGGTSAGEETTRSTSITTTISTETQISKVVTATPVLVAAIAAEIQAVAGSTIHNTAGALPIQTARRQTNTVVQLEEILRLVASGSSSQAQATARLGAQGTGAQTVPEVRIAVVVIAQVRAPWIQERAEVAIALEIEVCRRVRVVDRGAAPLVAPRVGGAAHAPAVRGAPLVWAALAAAGRVAVAAGGEEGSRSMNQENHMKSQTVVVGWNTLRASLLVALFGAVAAFGQVSSLPQQTTQKTFATPRQAADALIQAAEGYDLSSLTEILGPESEVILASEDPVRDKNNAAEFATKARQKNEVTVNPKNPKLATLLVGDDDWPLPIPLVQKGGKWLFDTKAGRQEILFRRIGSNELDAIQVCRGYVDAQHEYALEKHDNAKVNQYAQRVISTPGKHDGLVWRNADGSLGGPVAEGIAKALEQGYTEKSQPYHGYYFKILKGQGPAAPLGEMDFVVEGAMIGGFALAAAPAEYRVTGVQTFVVSHDGIVFQKDQGPDTLKIFSSMELYNPDKTWRATKDNW